MYPLQAPGAPVVPNQYAVKHPQPVVPKVVSQTEAEKLTPRRLQGRVTAGDPEADEEDSNSLIEAFGDSRGNTPSLLIGKSRSPTPDPQKQLENLNRACLRSLKLDSGDEPTSFIPVTPPPDELSSDGK